MWRGWGTIPRCWLRAARGRTWYCHQQRQTRLYWRSWRCHGKTESDKATPWKKTGIWSWHWISSKKVTKSGSLPLRSGQEVWSANPPTHSCEKLVLLAKLDRRPWQTCPELQKRLRNGFGLREIASDLPHRGRSTQRVVRETTSEAGTYFVPC